MSSHREAPEISKDPVADNTDVYAFVSPDAPSTVTLIANFLPLQLPNGGPNFYEFGDDVLYELHVSNQGTGKADISYQFRFTTHVRTPGSFLYNTGPITSITSPNWNRYQTFTCTRLVHATGVSTVLFQDKNLPPCNVGERSTPSYASTYTQQAIYKTGGQSVTKVFCGQRAEAFNVDLGSVFDLAGLRPLNQAHVIPLSNMPGVNGTQALNVHTIALQIPKKDLSRTGYAPTDASKPEAVIGVYASASRQVARSFDTSTGTFTGSGPFQQVSRLAMPLVNEVLTPMGQKDLWNSSYPSSESQFLTNYNVPELAQELPGLYPGAFPQLDAYNKSHTTRPDIVAIFLTGLPPGVVAGFRNDTPASDGSYVQAEMIRLNMAIAPKKTTDSGYSNLGLIGGDAAGFPNGRRVTDDVVTVELRALAGITIPLVDPTYKPDSILSGDALRDGTTQGATSTTFPYLADPLNGYTFTPGTATVG